ncbi:MAG: divergent polysaccharide deacetylase family protein [Alphaproteobacteria bacterium]|nr:divergent polysaccharide deacetylase family protein [Alphaproteobacteria bacterium]
MSHSESLPSPHPPRHRTFLARYPRNTKLVVTAVLLALVVLPPAFVRGWAHKRVAPSVSSDYAREDVQDYTPSTAKIETDVNAPALNDQNDTSIKLDPAPDSRITEDNAQGSLPRISEGGLRPWQVYARPFNLSDKRPRIAIVVTGLGLARTVTDEAISHLPPSVTLAFDSQGPVVGAWGSRARQAGHEILLEVPMEPFDYPRSDPGPDTLLTSLPNSDNLSRLMIAMRRATGYVGITTVSGSRFTTDSTKLAPILQVVHDRGLMVLDARSAPHSAVTDMSHNAGIPVATVTQRLDGDLSPEAIAGALADIERTARLNGRATGIVEATPVMIDQIEAWAKDLPSHGIALAPISAMVQ